MKKIILFLMFFMMIITSIFAFNPVSPSIFTIDFTAGLVANLGFSTKEVSSMIYPSDTILTNELKFVFNPATERFETGSFYVFCQAFSTKISSVSLTGTKLKSTDNPNSAKIDWKDTIQEIPFSVDTTSGEYSATIINRDSSYNPPELYCYELNLQISNIPSGVNWSDTYSGTLTLNITAK